MVKKNVQPEALATFAEASRAKSKTPDKPSLTATERTAPIPTDSKKKDKAATKVLREGVKGTDEGADEAIDQLPDRIVESRD
ncbi:MAG: hypothetical protein M3N38_09080 [Pseudomonadota bacterium]|nr:hypothetical protein [Pseudomonadota bacterium]